MEPPKDKNELIARIHAAWAALMTLIEPLTAEQWLYADERGWTVKDNLAHITEWERFLVNNQFRAMPDYLALGLEKDLFDTLQDVHALNAILFSRNQAKPQAQVQQELQAVHAGLMDSLANIPEEALHTPTLSLGGELEATIMWVIYNTYEHYPEHCQTIEATLQQHQ